MEQFFVGRNKEDFPVGADTSPISKTIFASELLDKKKFKNLKINHSTFANLGFKKSEFEYCDFQHSVFIDCYFKDATLSHVNFTGCKFINCNFDDAIIHHCDFDYARFESCYIKYDIIRPNLPEKRHNIRWELCINLGLECLRSGNSQEYRKFFFEEKRASEERYYDIIWLVDEHHRTKYHLRHRIESVYYLLCSKLSKLIWGYGENICQIFVVSSVITLFYAFSYWMLPVFNTESNTLTFEQAVYHSLANFFTLNSEYTSQNGKARWLAVTEGGLGILLAGFFVAALFKFINRR